MKELTNKEKFMFWVGILIAIGSGILTNLFVATALDIANNGYNKFNTSIYVLSGLFFLFIIIYVNKQLKRCFKENKK